MKLDNMPDIEVKAVIKLFEMLDEEGWEPVSVDAIMDQEHTISEFFEIYYNIRFGDFEDFMEALEAAALIELENYFE